MEGPKLTFLVASRNRREALAHCLETIQSQTYANRDIVVVDDGSDDGTAQMIAEQFPSVVFVRNEERAGIGVSLTRGAELATGDVWINLDDDAYLAEDNDAAEIVRLLAEYPDFDVLCFRCEAPDGSVRHREIPIRGKRLPTEPCQIAYFLGGAVAFRADALEAVGGYPADIKYGSWENAVSFRLFRAGKKILWAPCVRVVHLAIPSPYNTDQREANYIRTEMSLAARYLAFPYAYVHALLWVVLYGFLATVRGHLGPTLRVIWHGVVEWPRLRRDASERLTFWQTHLLSQIGGRTWY
jgi:glycosyltransferase involved in cell wall biosynthesis